jgi:hypothetical protein
MADPLSQWLSGWWLFATPLKNMSSSDWIIIPTIWENKKCSKPPTGYIITTKNLVGTNNSS